MFKMLSFLAAKIVCFLPLERLDLIFQILADRLDEYRRGHNGYTPRPLFKSAVEIGLSYACLELVIQMDDGVMLKQRETGVQGWSGMKHIPGISMMPFETLEQAQERLLKELTEDNELLAHLRLTNPFIRVYREDTDPKTEGRRVNCLTVVYSVNLSQEEIPKLKKEFIFVSCDQFSDESIVDHHRQTLKNFK